MQHIEKLKPDRVFCLGDIVGWLPWGHETLRTILDYNIPSVLGNHELLVLGNLVDSPSQIDRMQATAYTAGLLNDKLDLVGFIESLPLIVEEPDFIILHHSPFLLPKEKESITISHFSYLDEKNLPSHTSKWLEMEHSLIFSGHDHIPMLFELTDQQKIIKHPLPVNRDAYSINLKDSSRYWIKAGAVGGPYRDGVPCACTVMYDSSENTITFFRLQYDTSSLFKKLREHRFFRNIPTIQKYIRTLKINR